MKNQITRRQFNRQLGTAFAGIPLLGKAKSAKWSDGQVTPFLTPYKYEKLVLGPSSETGSFDSKSVDDPFVFLHDGIFHMLYIGFDDTGYQTGLARSHDLIHWERVGCVAKRDPNSKYTRFNVAFGCLLRDHQLNGTGEAKKVNGRFLGAWHAYPSAGYEVGAAVIGLAWSDDLLHWELTEPILFPEDGAPWEHGGLYRPNLIEQDGIFYLYYNAKTDPLPKSKGGGWHERSGVATSSDLKHWTRYKGNPILHNGGHDAWDARFASNPFVVQHNGLWGMYYFGYDWKSKARELLALGSDPYHFTKVNQIILDVGAPGTVDETFAHKPCVFYHQGALYHFYCAVSGKWPNDVRGISVARSKPW
ncbi:MAG TPA: hypothetical protein VG844_18180 [Terracidiphilus sp.]|nr:hypothetical protein [Terracidiphilus sp.]